MWNHISHTGAGLALSGQPRATRLRGAGSGPLPPPPPLLCCPFFTVCLSLSHTHAQLWAAVASGRKLRVCLKGGSDVNGFYNNKVWIKTNRFIFYWWSILFIIRVFVVNIHTKSFLSGGSEKQEVESITLSTASPAPSFCSSSWTNSRGWGRESCTPIGAFWSS